jgi:hypothetical protein
MNISEIVEKMGENEAQIIEGTDSFVAVVVKIPLSDNMMLSEENIQKGLNEAGKLATSCALSQFDTDGSPIEVAKIRYTSKGPVPKYYQTPYGAVYIPRHVYQNSSGGSTYCPLERDAVIIGGTTTPLFAKMVSSKYSQMSARAVRTDLLDNHSRNISGCCIQDINDAVGKIVSSRPNWSYAIPVEPSNVTSVGISLDGTCMLISGEGYRQAMVGSISLYDSDGERLYSRYTGMSPEYGKARFHESFTRDIESVKKLYPKATYVGIADGAVDNWTFLNQHVQVQILDYFHATEYLSSVSKAAFKRPFEEKEWFETAKHKLKYEKKGAEELLSEMNIFLRKRISKKKKEKIEAAITYFTNHLHQMNYTQLKKDNLPIGSGVIEAACKVIVKQRLCHSGMKWKDAGAKTVLTLRCLHESHTMWKQFWRKTCNIK